MAFDWSSYIDVAKDLRSLGRERHQRSSISRAYYAAFNITHNYLKKTKNYNKHQVADGRGGLRDATKHDNTHMSLGDLGHTYEANALSELRGLRNECDYSETTTRNSLGKKG